MDRPRDWNGRAPTTNGVDRVATGNNPPQPGIKGRKRQSWGGVKEMRNEMRKKRKKRHRNEKWEMMFAERKRFKSNQYIQQSHKEGAAEMRKTRAKVSTEERRIARRNLEHTEMQNASRRKMSNSENTS